MSRNRTWFQKLPSKMAEMRVNHVYHSGDPSTHDLSHADVIDLWGIKDDDQCNWRWCNSGKHGPRYWPDVPRWKTLDKRPCTSCSVLKVLCNRQPALSCHTSCSVAVKAMSSFTEVSFALHKLLLRVGVQAILWTWHHAYWTRKPKQIRESISRECSEVMPSFFQSSSFGPDQLIPPPTPSLLPHQKK